MDDLLKRIGKFQDKHDVEDSTFGKLALNDPAFVANLRDGRQVRRRTRRRVLDFIANYEPS